MTLSACSSRAPVRETSFIAVIVRNLKTLRRILAPRPERTQHSLRRRPQWRSLRPTNAIGIDQGRIERHDHRTEAVFDSIGQKRTGKNPDVASFIRAIEARRSSKIDAAHGGDRLQDKINSNRASDRRHCAFITCQSNSLLTRQRHLAMRRMTMGYFRMSGHRIRASSHSAAIAAI
jgi:hypothetical protein